MDDAFSFMGAEIVAQIIRDLVPLGLDGASSLLLAGSSAGGTGVMLNLDNVQRILHQELGEFINFFSNHHTILTINISTGLKHVFVRGISDSGWFLDRNPYSPTASPPIEGVKKGIELWRARIPPNCLKQYPGEAWRCYFGYRLYPTLTGECHQGPPSKLLGNTLMV